MPCTDIFKALKMRQDALHVQLARKVFFFMLQSAAGTGKSGTLNKQTNQIPCHPLYQIEGHSRVFTGKERKVHSSSIITAVFGSPLYYYRKFISRLVTSLLISSDSGFQFGEETPGFLSSINTTNLHSHHPPELIAGTESQGPSQK